MSTHAIPAWESNATGKPGEAVSYDSLLEDVMSEMSVGLSKMSKPEREEAVAEIQAIAEYVRKRQA